jgi:hypothetical protein
MRGKKTGELTYTYAEVLDLLRPQLAAEMGIGMDKLAAKWDGRRRQLTVTAEVEWVSPKQSCVADFGLSTGTIFEHMVRISTGESMADALDNIGLDSIPPMPKRGDAVRLYLTDGTHVAAEVDSVSTGQRGVLVVTVEGDEGEECTDIPSNGVFAFDVADMSPEAILDRVETVSWGRLPDEDTR